MTVSSQDTVFQHVGNGVTTVFAYGCQVPTATDLEVYLNDVLQISGYTISGLGTPTGGTVTFSVAPANLSQIRLERVIELERTTDYQQNGDFLSRVVNPDFDRIWMALQGHLSTLKRAIVVPRSDTVAPVPLPPAAQRANNLMGFDANGQPIAVVPTAGSAAAVLAALASTSPGAGAALIGRGVTMVDSVAAVLALSKTSPSKYAETSGYYAPGDGGNALYWRDDADTTSVHNGFTVLVAADGGRWKLMSLVDFNVKQAGAKGDGVTDDAAAFNKAISVCIALNRKKLKIPAGAYILGTRLTINLTGINGISLEGDGSTVTELRYNQGVDGMAIFMDDGNWWNETSPSAGVNLSGFTMSTKSLNTGVGLYIQGGSVVGRPPKRCVLTDVEWRSFSGFAQCWAQCVSLQDAADVWFNFCRWVMGGPGNLTPTGVDIKGTAGKDPSGFYFQHCEALYGGSWINAGSNVEGIYLTQCSHVAGNRAVFWNAGAESGLHVIGGHYNNIVGNFYLKGIFDFEIIGALLFSEGHAANPFIYIEIQDGMRWTISGNVMNSGGTGTETGIAVNNSQGGAGYGATIAGNAFNNLTGSPINLTPSAAYVTVGLNSYNNCTGADVVNSNPNTNRVERRRYTVSQVVTLVGGAITETVNIPIPTGFFKSKPDIGNVIGEGIQCIGFYDQPSGTSTATNMKVDLRKLDGVNFAAGPIRLSVIAEQ